MTIRAAALALCLALASCAPQYARMVRYEFDESYSEAYQKLQGYYQSHDRRFTLLQDELKTRSIETQARGQTEFITTRWATDIGSQPEFKALLTEKGLHSTLKTTELPLPKQLYDGTRLLTRSKLGNLKSLDSWIQANMRVISRSVGEDKDNPPLYPKS